MPEFLRLLAQKFKGLNLGNSSLLYSVRAFVWWRAGH